jgi:nitrate reductase (NAD(P)H)
VSAGWWYKPDYIINDININSAITSPAHEDLVTLAAGNTHFSIKGYAYSGGPRTAPPHGLFPAP